MHQIIDAARVEAQITGRDFVAKFEAEILPRFRERIDDLRAKADELAAQGTPQARLRARTLRCAATEDENFVGFALDVCDIGIDEAVAKWCPKGKLRKPR